ncbi:MAG: GNAT family N-acetyltransferase [Jiangellaceae bacterium]|nr:GNAT family N-acetyltransferase [Jiangellaceae bacterium]
MRIRPLRAEDVPESANLCGVAPTVVAHFLEHDAPGCWAADDAGSLAGVALSSRRDLLWCLARLTMRPEAAGMTAPLLEAALGYSRGCLRGLAVLDDDPATARCVRLAGFTLHPTMRLSGQVDRAALPIVDGVREGTDGDRALVQSTDRQVRGAARGPDHEPLLTGASLLVCDITTGSGYAFHHDGTPIAVAATRRDVGRRLLWEVLARGGPQRTMHVARLSAEQDWATDVGLAAGLGLHVGGYLALRHMRPPAPYLPAPVFG